jgi:hypothetical protein
MDDRGDIPPMKSEDGGNNGVDGVRALAKPHLQKIREAFIAARSRPLPSRRPHERALTIVLRQLDPNPIGPLLLHSAFHCIIRNSRFAAASRYVGEALRQECWEQGLLLDEPRQDTLSAINEYKQREWTVEELIRAGAWGLDLLVIALP